MSVPYPALDTPSILIDLDRLQANINAMARLVAQAGLILQPHTKVHKGTYVAKLQLAAGAAGVSVSKPSEVPVYIDAGIHDIVIVHPFFGEQKLAALKTVLPAARIRCVVDSLEGAQALAQVGQAVGKDVPVLLKIDTGIHRFGVSPGMPALRLARELVQIPGIELVGILSHESTFNETSAEGIRRLTLDSAKAMCDTARLLRSQGIAIKDVATGATPTAKILCEHILQFPEITELHPGAYVFGDRKYIRSLAMTESDCAATILTTVVSRPNSAWACVDGGQKTFSADPLLVPASPGTWQPTFGSIKGYSSVRLTRLSEEVGVLTLNSLDQQIKIGDRLEIIPNHIALAVNLHDKLYGVRNGLVEHEIPVLCQGLNY